MTPQITVQLYSVRDLAKQDYAGTIRAIAETGFGCVEPAGYPGSSAKDATKLFQELGLKAPSAHIGLPVGDNKNAIIEEALMMGHQYLITGCPPGFQDNYTSLDKVKAMAEPTTPRITWTRNVAGAGQCRLVASQTGPISTSPITLRSSRAL